MASKKRDEEFERAVEFVRTKYRVALDMIAELERAEGRTDAAEEA